MKKTEKGDDLFIAIIFFLLGISPIGVVIPGMILCSGAIGQGIECTPSILDGYLAPILSTFEVSFWFLIGFIWLIAAGFIWVKFIIHLFRYVSVKVPEDTTPGKGFNMFRRK